MAAQLSTFRNLHTKYNLGCQPWLKNINYNPVNKVMEIWLSFEVNNAVPVLLFLYAINNPYLFSDSNKKITYDFWEFTKLAKSIWIFLGGIGIYFKLVQCVTSQFRLYFMF